MSKLKKQLITVALSVLMVFAFAGAVVFNVSVAKADDDDVEAWLDAVVEYADDNEDGSLTTEELEAILEEMNSDIATDIYNIGVAGSFDSADQTKKDNFNTIKNFFREPNNLIANVSEYTANYRNNKMTYDEREKVEGWLELYNEGYEFVREEGWYVLVDEELVPAEGAYYLLDEDHNVTEEEWDGESDTDYGYQWVWEEGAEHYDAANYWIYTYKFRTFVGYNTDDMKLALLAVEKFNEILGLINTAEEAIENIEEYSVIVANEELNLDADNIAEHLVDSKATLEAAQEALDAIYAPRTFATATKNKSIAYTKTFGKNYQYFLDAYERYNDFVQAATDLNNDIEALYDGDYTEGLRLSIQEDADGFKERYNDLDEEQKELVDNYGLLVEIFEGIAEEWNVVQTVYEQIEAIGTVHFTEESKDLIDIARNGKIVEVIVRPAGWYTVVEGEYVPAEGDYYLLDEEDNVTETKWDGESDTDFGYQWVWEEGAEYYADEYGEVVVGGYENLREDSKTYMIDDGAYYLLDEESNVTEVKWDGESDTEFGHEWVEDLHTTPRNYQKLLDAEELYATYKAMYDDTLTAIDNAYENGTANNFKNSFAAAQKKYVALTTSTEKSHFLDKLANEVKEVTFNNVEVDNYSDLYDEMFSKNSANLRASEDAVKLIGYLAENVEDVKVWLTVEYKEKLDAANEAFEAAEEGGYADYVGNAAVLAKANELYDEAVELADAWLEKLDLILKEETIDVYNEETKDWEEGTIKVIKRSLSKEVFGYFLDAFNAGKALLVYVPFDYDEESEEIEYFYVELLEKYNTGYTLLEEYANYAKDYLEQIQTAVNTVLEATLKHAKGEYIWAVRNILEETEYEDGVDDDAAPLMGEEFKIKYTAYKADETVYANYINKLNGYILTIAKLINHDENGDLGEITEDMLKEAFEAVLEEYGIVIVDDEEVDDEEGEGDLPAIEIKRSEFEQAFETIKATIYGETIDYENFSLYFSTLRLVAKQVVFDLGVEALEEVTDETLYVVDIKAARKLLDDIVATEEVAYFDGLVDYLHTIINNSDLTVEYVNDAMGTASTELETLEEIETLYKTLHLTQRNEINALENSNRSTFLTNLNTARFNEQFAGLQDRIDAIETAIRGEAEEFDEEEIYAMIADLEAYIANVEAQGYDDTALKARLAELEAWVNAYEAYDDTALQTAVTALQTAVTALQNWVNAYEGYDDTALQTAVTALQNWVDAYEGYDDTALQTDVTALQTAVTALQNWVNAYEAYDDTALQTAVTALQNWVNAYEAYDDADLKLAIKALQDWVNAYKAYDDADLKAADKALEDRVKALEDKVKTLEENLGGVQGYCTGLLIALIVTFLVAGCAVVLVFLFKKKA